MKTLNRGVPETVLLAAHPTAGATFDYALPPNLMTAGHMITWSQQIAAGAFNSISTSLALSIDGTNFTIVDTTTVATGAVRSYGPTSAPFIRLVTTSHTPTTGDTDTITLMVII
jgi:hypothetical protein